MKSFKIMKLITIVLLAFLLFLSCSYKYGRVHYKKLSMDSLQLGMTKQDVIDSLGHKPYSIVGAKQELNHTVEVWLYIKAYQPSELSPERDIIEQRYYLYFYDGILEKWSNLGDWEREANEIFEIRIKGNQ